MILFPAIDLKDGHCVRLRQGEMAEATVFNTDPAAQARAFEEQGFEWLHVVDLNGAFAGRPVNDKAVEAIFDAVHISIQLGGGIRDLDTIVAWLERGVDRVVLGTAAVRNPALVKEADGRRPTGESADHGAALRGFPRLPTFLVDFVGNPRQDRPHRSSRAHVHCRVPTASTPAPERAV